MGQRILLVTALTLTALLIGAGLLVNRTFAVARRSTTKLLEERLTAIGVTASVAIPNNEHKSRVLAEIVIYNKLDSAYLFDPTYTVIADNRRPTPRPVNRLLLDPQRAQQALAGTGSVGWGYDVEEARFLSGYFPVQFGATTYVLVIDAGEAFIAEERSLRSSLLGLAAAGLGLVLLFFAMFAVVVRLTRRERESFAAAETARATAGLAAIVAHEIRNPLGILRGSAELLAERAGAAEQELARDIVDEADRMNRITEDFLQLAIERPLHREAVSLDGLLQSCRDATRRRYPDVTIELAAPHTVDADPARLRQVFLNLFNNAAQAQGGTGRIAVSSEERRGRIVIRVADDGPGLSTPLPESHLTQGTTTKRDGHGLGLLVVRRLVEQHGGGLRSVPVARGATFEIDLPPAAPAELAEHKELA